MKIISTTDTGKTGNKCYINGNISLVEQFGVYSIIICQNVTGDAEWKDVQLHYTTEDYNDAVKQFNHYVEIFSD